MKVKYLNYEQAAALSENFQRLVGRPFNRGGQENFVRQVVIAPYSRIIQWQFVRSVIKGTPPDEALTLCVNNRYDVILLSSRLKNEDGAYEIKTLGNYLAEHELAEDTAVFHV